MRQSRTWKYLQASAIALMVAGMGAPAFADDTLKFVSWQKDEKGVGDWFENLIDQFEASHPGVKIEFTKVEASAYAPTMTTLFASGSPPDIVHVAAFDYPRFAANGWLEPLDKYIEEAGLDLDGWSGQEKCKWEGETVCIVNLYFGFVMGYNQELLDEAGIAVPTNYQEFYDAAAALTKDTDGDGIIDQYGTGHEIRDGVSWYVTEMLNYMLPHGAFWTNSDGEVTMDTPEMVAALTDWKAMNLSGSMPRDPKPGDTRVLFTDGTIAMKIDGPWIVPIMTGAAPEMQDKLKLTQSPLNPPVGGNSNVLAIASEISDEHKQLVWDFIKLATSDENQTLLATLGESLPPSPRADLSAAMEQRPELETLITALRTASKAGIDRIPVGLESAYNEMARMVMEETERMIINDLDPADAAKTLQERAEQIQEDM